MYRMNLVRCVLIGFAAAGIAFGGQSLASAINSGTGKCKHKYGNGDYCHEAAGGCEKYRDVGVLGICDRCGHTSCEHE